MALFPPRFINATVAIGTLKDNKEIWIGSGFLYGHALPDDANGSRVRLFVVSNKHVFQSLKNVIVKFNPIGKTEPLDIFGNFEDGTTTLFLHPQLDLGAFNLLIDFEGAGITGDHFFYSGDILTRQEVRDTGITEGDFAYLLGFPASIIDDGQGYVVVRHGSIARVFGVISRAERIIYLLIR
jgi:hypothetical protein